MLISRICFSYQGRVQSKKSLFLNCRRKSCFHDTKVFLSDGSFSYNHGQLAMLTFLDNSLIERLQEFVAAQVLFYLLLCFSSYCSEDNLPKHIELFWRLYSTGTCLNANSEWTISQWYSISDVVTWKFYFFWQLLRFTSPTIFIACYSLLE